MTFDITYYNGLSSKANIGKLYLRKNSWLIEYKDNYGNIIHNYWFQEKIKPVEISGNSISLSYGSFPPSTLECTNSELLQHLDSYKSNTSVSAKLFRYLNKKGRKAVVLMTTVLVGFIALIYFILLPLFAEFVTAVMPVAYEEKLGHYISNQFLNGFEINYELSEVLNEFSQNINYDTKLNPEIIAVKSNQVNAFALPGGKIVIYDGLLKKMENEEQLAALLCHEMAHVKHRHSLKAMFRNLGGYLFISWLFTDINAVTAIIVENAHSFHTLSYSRDLEHEADTKALEMLERNDISQKGMVDLFYILMKEELINISGINFLSTHPLTDERIRYSTKSAEAQKNDNNKNPLLEEKWNRIEEILN